MLWWKYCPSVRHAVLYSNLWHWFLRGYVNDKERKSTGCSTFIVAQGVYCIGPKFKAEKESPKIKFSSQCPDFLEKNDREKNRTALGAYWLSKTQQNQETILAQRLPKKKRIQWKDKRSSQVIRPLLFWKTDKKRWSQLKLCCRVQMFNAEPQ